MYSASDVVFLLALTVVTRYHAGHQSLMTYIVVYRAGEKLVDQCCV